MIEVIQRMNFKAGSAFPGSTDFQTRSAGGSPADLEIAAPMASPFHVSPTLRP